MGEFHDGVKALLQTFSSGISIIKTQRGRRKQEKLPIDPSRKAAESDLSRSLKRNRREVKTAYERDVSVLGPGFSAGDEEAHSSLASILLRLNAGFVSIIERFTRGKSSQADYQALINLSNSSRIEAMKTFEQLSKRISQTSLVLAPTNGNVNERHKRKRRSSKKGGSSSKTKSASSLAVTPLGIATTEGWVRPKVGRKSSSESRGSGGSSTAKKVAPKISSTPKALPAPLQAPPIPRAHPAPPSPPLNQGTPPPAYQNRTVNRKSIMSFASDSTKLGEIPEYKWLRPEMFDVAEGGDIRFPVTTFYPIEPYREPEKQKGRLRKLFRM